MFSDQQETAETHSSPSTTAGIKPSPGGSSEAVKSWGSLEIFREGESELGIPSHIHEVRNSAMGTGGTNSHLRFRFIIRRLWDPWG